MFLIYQRAQPTTAERAQSAPVQRPLTQLTFDSGLQAEPTFSPDGSFLAYSSGKSGNFDIWVMSVGGGDAVQVTQDPAHDWQPDWSPDGKRVSLWGGHRSDRTHPFITISLDGGDPVVSDQSKVDPQTEAAGVLLYDFIWEPSGRALYFEGFSRGVRNIWKVIVDSDTLRWVGGPERLTAGPGLDTDMALSRDGKVLVFTARREKTRIWSLPFDVASGKIQNDGRPITLAGITSSQPALSHDGKKIVFIARRGVKQELWKKSLEDGHETLLTADNFRRSSSHWSPDGKYLAYTRQPAGSSSRERVMVVMPADGGEEQIITRPQGAWNHIPYSWSPDGRWLVGHTRRGTPEGSRKICMVPISGAPKAETEMRVIASSSDLNLWQPYMSPEGRWISFEAVSPSEAGFNTIYVVPASGGDWIRITAGKHIDHKPRWAPDGKTIYILSARGGFMNVWGRRFDPVQGKPVGRPFQVTAFESPSRMVHQQMVVSEISLSSDRLVLPIMDGYRQPLDAGKRRPVARNLPACFQPLPDIEFPPLHPYDSLTSPKRSLP